MLQAAAMRSAAEAAGLAFVENPIIPGMMPQSVTQVQRETVEGAGGPVLAYCHSGTRSTVAWMMAFAPDTAPDALLATARQAGYALDMLRPQLQALHEG